MMEKAGTSIQSICRAHQGAHYCLFYRSQQDLVDLLVQYFRYGLENNEFCIWVAADTTVEQEARKALSALMPDVDSSKMEERIEFAQSTEWYLRDGSFQSDRVSKSWYDRLEHSIGHGYNGIRVTGDLGWHDDTIWQSLVEYEMHLNDMIPNTSISAICSYPLEKLDTSKLLDIMRHHQLAIIKNNGEWHIVETLKAEKSADFLNSVIASTGIETQLQDVPNLPLLDPDRCNGCGLCIDVCENGLLFLENDKIVIQESGTCSWCTYCEIVCPSDAITCPFEIIVPGT
jgi:ferredoxin